MYEIQPQIIALKFSVQICFLEYLPTQFITEFIKSRGYAGVSYTSTMGTGGTNIAVFDETLFECESVHVVEINSIEYSYSNVN